MKLPVSFIFLLCTLCLSAQTNFLQTNPLAHQVLIGNYDAATFAPPAPFPANPTVLGSYIADRIRPDSLKSYLLQLTRFKNRNTGSDTLSASNGIGAARRWAYQKLESFSAANQNRLLVSFFQFDQSICNIGQHRNIIGVLPGANPAQNGVVLLEAHIDSRCESVCDTSCIAEGMEDNASGTALVLELARVMASFQFPNTIVFMITIGEEQGLYGAYAFVNYALQYGIPLRAVLNNDVIGGIVCGQTSSPPSCPGLNDIDSTSVRLFSAGNFNSTSKQLARFIKLQYQENLRPSANVPMNVRIMAPEDRTGRGGDHIPFREKGFPAMRFTSANEHGDASITPNYTDRQHSTRDILGLDTNGDLLLDSFFVDVNYLQRNASINGNAAAMIAQAVPPPPGFTAARNGSVLQVQFTPPAGSQETIRIALRSTSNDWDTVYTVIGGASAMMPCNPTGPLIMSLARQNDQGVESLFGPEKIVTTVAVSDPEASEKPIQLFQNKPNPFDEATWISWYVNEIPSHQKACIQISDLKGNILEIIPVQLQTGLNEILYTHGYGMRGALLYSLVLDGKPVDSRKMIFAN